MKSTLQDHAGHKATRLFMCGDVMTGRGIDQILPHPSQPHLFEVYVKDARDYVRLAERTNGKISRPVAADYIWGHALQELEVMAPDWRIINLETSVTTSEDFWPGKGINYRMHPANIGCLQAAAIDCCVLGNNHVLDWGYAGLGETLRVLDRAGFKTAGAGANLSQAQAPAILEKACGRVLVFSFAAPDSGVPASWAARPDCAGVNLLPDFSQRRVEQIAGQVRALKRAGDLVVASIHWGGNWGYDIPAAQRDFAHQLIDLAGVDLVHGHSSHHAKGIEVYHHKLVIYGCGDFLNDYEGIEGYEGFRDDLALMYFPTLDRHSGRLLELLLSPVQIMQMRLQPVSEADYHWLRRMLNRVGAQFDTGVAPQAEHLRLTWP